MVLGTPGSTQALESIWDAKIKPYPLSIALASIKIILAPLRIFFFFLYLSIVTITLLFTHITLFLDSGLHPQRYIVLRNYS